MTRSEKIAVIVAGSKGRLGSLIAKLVNAADDMYLAAEAEYDIPLESVIKKGEVVIDFTIHHAAVANAKIAAKHNIPIVIGTTGLSEEEVKEIRNVSKIIPLVFAPNMSIGVNVMWKLVEVASRALTPDFKVDLVETHHVKKFDRPSGTANKILDIVLDQSGWKKDQDVSIYEEVIPEQKTEKPVRVCSVRKGDVVGDHTILFTGSNESIEITHHAFTREVFAQGAVTAARWLVGKPAGLYCMTDVLNIS